MAYTKVGSRNDPGGEALVYIRRLSPMTAPPGNWASWDYYVMASLPTNDNPRYSTYNTNDDQDILTSRYYRYQIGPSDMRIQQGKYPPVYDTKLRYKMKLPTPTFPEDVESSGYPAYRLMTLTLDSKEFGPAYNTETYFQALEGFNKSDPGFTDYYHGIIINEEDEVHFKVEDFSKYDNRTDIHTLDFSAYANFWLTGGGPTAPHAQGMSAELLNIPDAPRMAAQVRLMATGVDHDNGNDRHITFYHEFVAETGKITWGFIPYRVYQTGEYGTGYISWTGTPTVSFAFNTLPRGQKIDQKTFEDELPIMHFYEPPEKGPSTPNLSPQSGVIILNDKRGKVQRTPYTMVYPYTYKYVVFDSLETGGFENSEVLADDPSNMVDQARPMHLASKIANETHIHVPLGSGVVQDLNGAQMPFGGGWERRRNVGTQNRALPLHELNSFRDFPTVARLHGQGVGCKATHLAYKIGTAGKASEEHYNFASSFGSLSNKDELITANNPAVLLFNNSYGFYSRLPECWPWSCRRWTVETSIKFNKNKDGSTNYKSPYLSSQIYTQDKNGKKYPSSLGAVPRFNVEFESWTGDNSSESVPILNGDPNPIADIAPDGRYPPNILPPKKETFFNGYYHKTMPISSAGGLGDAELMTFGCDPERTDRVALAIEVFPILHEAQCKLIMKIGYLCYPTGCNTPDMGLGNKKIIYPFNSCRFNETMKLDLGKINYKKEIPVIIEADSLEFDEAEGYEISYLKLDPSPRPDPDTKIPYPQIEILSSGVKYSKSDDIVLSYLLTQNKNGIGLIDPYGYKDSVTQTLSEELFVHVPDGYYLTTVARKECYLTSNKIIFQSIYDKTEDTYYTRLIADLEYNKDYYCPEDPLYNVKKYDPYYHPDGVTLSLAEAQSVNLYGFTGYISVVARKKCFYTSDMYIYQRKDNNTVEVTSSPLNQIYKCFDKNGDPMDALGRVTIYGNGTDYPEPKDNVVTGGDYYLDKKGNQVQFNLCDPPRRSEIYRSTSIGNARGYIEWQANCCDFCGEKKDGALVSPAKGPTYNCAILDIEGTPESMNHYARVGGCDSNMEDKCVNKLIKGRAKLRSKAKMIGEQDPPPSFMHSSGYMYGQGIMRIMGSGWMPVSGLMESGNPSIFTYGSTVIMNADMNLFEEGADVYN